MWPPGLPHGILCTRLQYVHIEAWYTGSFGVARIPAGYVPKNQNLKKLSGNRSEKGLKCVQKENGPQKSHKQCMKHTSLIQQKSLIYSFPPPVGQDDIYSRGRRSMWSRQSPLIHKMGVQFLLPSLALWCVIGASSTRHRCFIGASSTRHRCVITTRAVNPRSWG